MFTFFRGKRERQLEKRIAYLENRLYYDYSSTGCPTGQKLEIDLETFDGYVLFSDMNGMGKINKEFDHEVGDLAVVFMANKLKEIAEKHGINLYRRYHSGDEFIFLIKGDYAYAYCIFKDISSELNGVSFQFEYENKIYRRDLSATISEPQYHMSGSNDSLKNASKNMLQRKWTI
jgi:GGDEF domain-containing protein